MKNIYPRGLILTYIFLMEKYTSSIRMLYPLHDVFEHDRPFKRKLSRVWNLIHDFSWHLYLTLFLILLRSANGPLLMLFRFEIQIFHLVPYALVPCTLWQKAFFCSQSAFSLPIYIQVIVSHCMLLNSISHETKWAEVTEILRTMDIYILSVEYVFKARRCVTPVHWFIIA